MAAEETADHVQSCFRVNLVVAKRATFFELLASVQEADEALLVADANATMRE